MIRPSGGQPQGCLSTTRGIWCLRNYLLVIFFFNIVSLIMEFTSFNFFLCILVSAFVPRHPISVVVENISVKTRKEVLMIMQLGLGKEYPDST
jgi:hypothetical protein